MRLSDFDFPLPDDRIALRPAEPRDSARLLVVQSTKTPALTDATVHELLRYLRKGDVMVFNDTRVIPAQLSGIRQREGVLAKVEITLHKRVSANEWIAFAKPGKRLASDDMIAFTNEARGAEPPLQARVLHKSADGDVHLKFDLSGPMLEEAIALCGRMPLPPYIAQKRSVDARDVADYQTVYAREKGAVAAPTAGLHFTPEMLAAIDALGVRRCFVTLHVGAGTFLPVKTDDVSAHRMHSEWGCVSAETAVAINQARSAGGRLICVGTTSLRLIESSADESGVVQPFSGDTAIFITPGYRFRAADMLMTNFHLPKSTLFMLVSAFAGTRLMREAYAHAIRTGYRFYSYGDSSLLYRAS